MRPSRKVALIVTLSIVLALAVHRQFVSINDILKQRAAPTTSTNNKPQHKNEEATAVESSNVVVDKRLQDTLPVVSTTWPPLSNDLNYCTQPFLKAAGQERGSVRVENVCAGPAYDAFTTQLHALANNQTRFGKNWGRRTFAIPPDKTVLMVGNPHTRLVAQVLACQHMQQQQSLSSSSTNDNDNNERNLVYRIDKFPNGAVRVILSNRATLITVTNPPALYGPEWAQQLAMQLNFTSLQHNVDALILGLVDEECPKGYSTPCRPPPNVSEWARVLRPNTPLAFVSHFSLNNQLAAQGVVKELRQQQQQQQQQQETTETQTALIYSRRFIREMQIECASGSKKGGGDCQDKIRGARCTGKAGGHADLVAWDVAEFLHGALGDGSDAFPALPPTEELQPVPNNNEDYFLCRSPVITATHDLFSDTTDLEYQCQGPRYEAFGQALKTFVETERQPLPPRWAIPADKKVLFFGNSHVKQVGKAIACQQMEAGQLESFNMLRTLGGAQLHFTNNVTVVMLFNSFVPYSRNWLALLESELEMKLDSFDAVMYGFMNHCDGDNTFGRTMRKISNERDDVDCLKIEPPNLLEFADVYEKPIVFVPMLDMSRTSETIWLAGQIPSLVRDNVMMLNVRQYQRRFGKECFSPARLEVSDCAEDKEHASHACNGHLGGFADLLAWDAIDFFHRNLIEEEFPWRE